MRAANSLQRLADEGRGTAQQGRHRYAVSASVGKGYARQFYVHGQNPMRDARPGADGMVDKFLRGEG